MKSWWKTIDRAVAARFGMAGQRSVPSSSTAALVFFGSSLVMRAWLGEKISVDERERLAGALFDIDNPRVAFDMMGAQLLDARDAGDEQAMRGCASALKILVKRWEVVEPARSLLVGAIDHWHDAERLKLAVRA